MSGRGRSTTPKTLTPSPRREGGGRDISMSPPSRPSPLAVVIVHGLSKNVMRAHLEEIFGEYGKITGLDLPLFKVSGLNQGKAAIEFDQVTAADDAVRCMNGGVLDGNVLKVELSRHPLPSPREPSPPPPPVRRRSLSRSPPRDGGFGGRSPPARRSSFARRRSPSPWRRSPSPRGAAGDTFRRPPPAYGPNARGPVNRYGGRGGYGPPAGGSRFRSRSPLQRRDVRGGGSIRRGSPDYVRGGRSRSPRRRRSYTPSRSRSRSPVARRRSPSYSRSRSFSPRPRSASRSRSPLPRRDRSVSIGDRSSRSASPRP